MPSRPAWPSDWLTPRWPAPARVKALMSTRTGGVSSGLFESMNLGDHVGDEPASVAVNRGRLAELIQARPVFMRQVHGVEVAHLDALAAAPFAGPPLQADGALSLLAGQACTIMVADCLPILLTHERMPVVAALHAGWRGLAGQGGYGIVEAGLARLRAATGLAGSDLASGLMAWLGPCIGPQAFEVGAEVREAFVRVQPEAHACFQPGKPGKFLADLAQLARLRLALLGVHRVYGNDGGNDWCTVTQSGFFSHRRVSGRPGTRIGDTGGRMAACIWLD